MTADRIFEMKEITAHKLWCQIVINTGNCIAYVGCSFPNVVYTLTCVPLP